MPDVHSMNPYQSPPSGPVDKPLDCPRRRGLLAELWYQLATDPRSWWSRLYFAALGVILFLSLEAEYGAGAYAGMLVWVWLIFFGLRMPTPD